jgi:GntR family transcriptional repressor for pyruvate dehydrogenase complex
LSDKRGKNLLVPIVRVTTSQAAADKILDLIRRGLFKSGDQLPSEKEFGEQLGVGRSTVREALQILATLNVVQASPGQGTFVKEPTTADMLRTDVIGFLIQNSMALELLEAREMIEPTLVRLACLRGTEADFDRIERLLREHESALRRDQSVSEYAARFHILLAEAAHNRVALIFMSSILELLMSRGRQLDAIPGYKRRELQEHRELLRLVRSRDAERAAAFLLQHIVDSAATYARDGMTKGRPLLADVAPSAGPFQNGEND